MKRKKILILSAFPPWRLGGSSRHVNYEIKYVLNNSNLFGLLIFWPKDHYKDKQNTSELGLRFFSNNVVAVPLARIKQNLMVRGPLRDLIDVVRLSFLLRKIHKHFKPNIIHSHHPLTALASIIAGNTAKTVLTLHSPYSLDKFTMGDQLLLSRHRVLMLLRHLFDLVVELVTYNLVRVIIAVSELELSHIEKFRIIKRPIFIVRNGIDPKPYILSRQSRNLLRQHYKISDDKIVCLFLGRMVRKNGVITIARAAKLLHLLKSNSNSDLIHKIMIVMVGDGPDLPFIRKLTGDVPSETFIMLPALPMEAIIGLADIFVSHVSSLVEGFGLTILEAMAAGVPVVTGFDKIKGQVFKHCKEIYFIKKDNPVDLLNGLIRLANDLGLRKYIAENAREKILKEFTYNVSFGKFFSLMRRLNLL